MLELEQLENSLGMNLTVQQSFTDIILQYSKDNLVTLTAYIGDSYVTVLETDQVIY